MFNLGTSVIFISVFVSTFGFGNIKKPSKPQTDEEAHVYPCFREATCNLGPETVADLEVCYTLLNAGDWTKSRKVLLASGFKNVAETSNAGAVMKSFCPWKEQERKEIFWRLAGELTAEMSKMCTPETPECKRFQAMINCVFDIIDREHENQNCQAE